MTTSRLSTADANAAYIVKQAVCREYGISLDDMKLKTRRLQIAYPRQVAMWLCNRFYNWGNSMTSEAFARSDGTATQAFNTIDSIMDTGPKEKKRILKVAKEIYELAQRISPIYHKARIGERRLEEMTG